MFKWKYLSSFLKKDRLFYMKQWVSKEVGSNLDSSSSYRERMNRVSSTKTQSKDEEDFYTCLWRPFSLLSNKIFSCSICSKQLITTGAIDLSTIEHTFRFSLLSVPTPFMIVLRFSPTSSLLLSYPFFVKSVDFAHIEQLLLQMSSQSRPSTTM